MLQPITLKNLSNYKLCTLNVEEIGNLYDLGLINTGRPKEEFMERVSGGATTTINIRYNISTVDVPIGQFLVLQYDNFSRVTGVLSFSSMSDVREFFDVPESIVDSPTPESPTTEIPF